MESSEQDLVGEEARMVRISEIVTGSKEQEKN